MRIAFRLLERECIGKCCFQNWKPLSTNKLTSRKGRLSFARILAKFDASIELVWLVKIKLPNGRSRVQQVCYEHESTYCSTSKVV